MYSSSRSFLFEADVVGLRYMAQGYSKSISIPKALLKKKEGIAVLPLDEYEQMKEELEMFRSKSLAGDIEAARKEVKSGEVLSLEEVDKKPISILKYKHYVGQQT